MTGGDYTYGEHSTMYRIVESRCCIPETNITFYVNYTSIKKVKYIRGKNIHGSSLCIFFQ